MNEYEKLICNIAGVDEDKVEEEVKELLRDRPTIITKEE